jgi:hypothetical protein
MCERASIPSGNANHGFRTMQNPVKGTTKSLIFQTQRIVWARFPMTVCDSISPVLSMLCSGVTFRMVDDGDALSANG